MRKRILAIAMALCMLLSVMPVSAMAADSDDSATVASASSEFLKIAFLDCGREYFTVAQIETLIDAAAAADYNYVELAVGNDGLRFLLDDMSLTVDGTTYDSDTVTNAIQAGNKAYRDCDTNELTETEMDEIISYAGEKGIEIIPLINTPGHMDAILYAADSLTNSSLDYGGSSRTIDVTNATAVAFTQALLQKYIDYFDDYCTYFNMGCDEYANDVYTSGSMGFGRLQSDGNYGSFVTYVNEVAKMVKDAGMTPMAFNDGIYFNDVTSSGTFDTNIMVCYWSSGWTGYDVASANTLAKMGHSIVNTNGDLYYVQYSSSDTYSAAYSRASSTSYAYDTVMGDDDGSVNPVGVMLCYWCDAAVSDNDAGISNFSNILTAFAENNTEVFAVSAASVGDADEVEATETKTITLTVGESSTITVSGSNYSDSYTSDGLKTDIATVTVSGTDAGAETDTYTQVTSNVTYNSLGLGNSTALTATIYYCLVDGSYYQLYVQRSTSWGSTTYRWYYYDSNNAQQTVGSQTGQNMNNTAVNVTTLYTLTTTAATEASTTITVTGVSAGTTTVTVGDTVYTIVVTAAPLEAELWCTNMQVEVSGVTSTGTATYSNNGTTTSYDYYYIDLTSDDLASYPLVSGIVESKGIQTGVTNGTLDAAYWKAIVLDEDDDYGSSAIDAHWQNPYSGNRGNTRGIEISALAYIDGEYCYLPVGESDYIAFDENDQLVFYYLMVFTESDYATAYTADWGTGGTYYSWAPYLITINIYLVDDDGNVTETLGTHSDYFGSGITEVVIDVDPAYELVKITQQYGSGTATDVTDNTTISVDSGSNCTINYYIRALSTYTVTYSWTAPPSGYSVPVDDIAYTSGSTVTVNSTYTDGQTVTVGDYTYTFHGWYLDSAHTNKVDSFTITANTTLYGYWTKSTDLVLSYDANGGTGAPASESQKATSDGDDTPTATFTVSDTVPTYTGYTFDGWNTAADGSGDSYSADDTIEISEDTTLYAQWKLIETEVTLSYDANGGSGA
ncbi:MAG: family 20 glycosylhydrolase, partial [Oscillospiraceae bacterium]|nr:family 20 glycosylhydrolase [Oscillospiraceae bacterium]